MLKITFLFLLVSSLLQAAETKSKPATAAPATAQASKPAANKQPAASKAALSAQDILKKAFTKDFLGVKQGTAQLQMDITAADKSVKNRTLSLKTRTDDKGLVSYLVKFEAPADIKGTAFLVREKEGALPEQSIYIPAAKVVRKVAAGNAAGSFFGSDFIYGDLLPFPEDSKNQVELKRLDDATVKEQAVYVVEIKPLQAGSPYKKIVAYIDQTNSVALKMEFYDAENKLLKVLEIKALKKIGTRLMPVDLQMKNVQKGSETRLQIQNINTSAQLSAADFTENAMQK